VSAVIKSTQSSRTPRTVTPRSEAETSGDEIAGKGKPGVLVLPESVLCPGAESKFAFGVRFGPCEAQVAAGPVSKG
jgi:hypothetical protein